MNMILKFVAILSFIASVLSKKSYFKEDLETKDKDAKIFMNILKDGELFTEKERFARHMEVITENVLEHIMKELKHQYSNKNYSANSPIRRLIRKLNKKMKRKQKDKIKETEMKTANKKIKKNKKKTTMTVIPESKA